MPGPNADEPGCSGRRLAGRGEGLSAYPALRFLAASATYLCESLTLWASLRGAGAGLPGRGGRPGAPASPPCGRERCLKQLSFPSLCSSCAGAAPRLPSACACVYSSPSRRTPVDAAARTPRTGYCGRRRRSDRPFRTGLQKGGLRSAERPFESPRLS